MQLIVSSIRAEVVQDTFLLILFLHTEKKRRLYLITNRPTTTHFCFSILSIINIYMQLHLQDNDFGSGGNKMHSICGQPDFDQGQIQEKTINAYRLYFSFIQNGFIIDPMGGIIFLHLR